ncbi:hypothetical protein FJQ98_20385 [Lysinibacillus agricola]|uniref:Lipoprotein n=1 Tax=Lysinibacillus agricola TaxID=2590012 RepID=A0ABX7ANL3_9BACI|nr:MULTISPECIES: hypothetical protein [Lysinibacillus]QQP11532.1 hypothetical protein FJQ98_20385 [Lysinibacillus agricola]
MKKLVYIGALSALLLAACGEEKVEETDKAQEELDKAKEKEAEQAKKEAEEKAKEEEERKAKEAEEKAKLAKEQEEVDKEEPTTAEKSKPIINTSVFEYAQAVDVTDAIDLNNHVTLIISMSEAISPGLATQHVVNQVYDFVQQVDVKGAKTIGINVKQGANKIAQFTVYTDKLVPNDDEPMSDAVIVASEIEFMTDEVKAFGKTIGSW